MNRISALSAAILAAASLDAQSITSIANGNAQTPTTWSCSCVPPNSAKLVVNHAVTLSVARTYASITVNTGGHFLKNGSGGLTINGSLTILSGGLFTNDQLVTVKGNYYNAGTHAGSKDTRLTGTNKLINGAAGGNNISIGSFVISGGDKTVPVDGVIVKSVGLLRIEGVTVTNNGRIEVGDMSSQASGSFLVQGNTGWLLIKGTLGTNLELDASANGNTVEFGRTGANQSIKNTVGGVYHHLRLTSNSMAYKKSLRGNIEILGDLYFANCTFDSRGQGMDYDLTIAGHWTNDGAVFNPRQRTVRFVNANPVGLTHLTSENFYNLLIDGTDTLGLRTPILVQGDLANNGILDVSIDNRTISVQGNWTNNGTFVRRSGNVIFNGSGSQVQYGRTEYNDLTVDKTTGTLTVDTARQKVFGTLTITNGTYNTNDHLSMASNADGDSRIAPISSGTLTGQVYVQRYIDAGATNWRFLTAPVAGATLADWQDNFVTSGYAGSHWPAFPFTSIYFHDESAPGTEDDGFVPATSSSDLIGIGQGLWVWCGDSLGGTGNFTIDVKGPAYTGPIDLPVSYNSFGSPVNDGWSMVANPYVSAIDWDSPNWTKTNINNAVYIWNPDDQNFAGYVGGVSVNGGSNLIASSQAFWVQANGPAPVLRATENVKSASSVGFKSVTDADLLRLRVTGNGLADEAVIRVLPGATTGFDAGYDAYEKFSANQPSPNICSRMPGGMNAMVNTVPPFHVDTTFIVKVKVGVTGSYEIQFTELSGAFGAACLEFEDVVEGISVPMLEGGSYSFAMGAAYNGNRFRVHASAPMTAASEPASCSYMNAGSIPVTPTGMGPFTYNWADPDGNWIQTHTQNGADSLVGILPGTYLVTLDGQGSCPQQALEVEVTGPAAIEPAADIMNAGCPGQASGSIDLATIGGQAPYAYVWSNGSVTEDITALAAGTYSVDITDANDCMATGSFVVNEDQSVTASFVAPASAMAGQAVYFANNTADADQFAWYFGDGTPVDSSQSPWHVYDAPGTYTVTLTASIGTCSNTATAQIIIDENTTGIADPVNGADMWIGQEGSQVFVHSAVESTINIQIDNVVGQRIAAMERIRIVPGRMPIALPQHAPDVLMFTLTRNDGQMITQKIVR